MIYKNVEFSAIVTKRKNYRERDMLVTMFTDKYGFNTFSNHKVLVTSIESSKAALTSSKI